MMKKAVYPKIAALALVLLLTAMLCGCGRTQKAAETAAPAASPEPAAVSGMQDGERFEARIVMEGMEETVRYEHIRNGAIGIEMDYDYEKFERRSEAERERIVSLYDRPEAPENYLEITYSPRDAATVAAAIGAELSHDYEISRNDAYPLGRAGSCIRIDASADKGGLTMPDHLQMVYVVPASDGCRVAIAHYAAEGAEGFGRRFSYMMNSLAIIGRSAGT